MGSLQGNNRALTTLNIISHLTATPRASTAVDGETLKSAQQRKCGGEKAKAETPSENVLLFERKDRRLIN